MKKQKEFDNILDECLERILAKGETIEQCLAGYPEYADELEPLLQTAVLTKETSAVKPRAEFMDRARYQFHSALQEMEEKRERRFSFFSWQPRWVTVAITILVLLLASGGTVAAAGNSMPDEPLYPVKLAAEKVQVVLTPSALGKAELYARLADKRVAEIIHMADKGKPEQVERVTQRLNEHLMAMAAFAAQNGVKPGALPAQVPSVAEEAPAMPGGKNGKMMAPRSGMGPPSVPAQAESGVDKDGKVDKRAKLRMMVARHAVEHPAALRAALQKVPEAARPALLRAIAASDAEYKKALEALEGKEEEVEDESKDKSEDN